MNTYIISYVEMYIPKTFIFNVHNNEEAIEYFIEYVAEFADKGTCSFLELYQDGEFISIL